MYREIRRAAVRWAGRYVHARKSSVRFRHLSRRLHLESLEHRQLLAVIVGSVQPDVRPIDLQWHRAEDGGGFTFQYEIENPDAMPLADAFLDFHWDAGPGSAPTDGVLAFRFALVGDEAKAEGVHAVRVWHNEATLPDRSLIEGHRSPPIVDPLTGDRSSLLHLVVDSQDAILEQDETNNLLSAKVVPLVVSVLTHGLNPGYPWDSFRAPWFALAEQLEQIPEPDSILDGRVATTVVQWDSRNWFFDGLNELVASYIYEQDYLHDLAEAHATGADQVLNVAALRTMRNLTEGDAAPLLADADASSELQRILLIGHSRGAGLNARLSRFLERAGYEHQDYLSLDGYANDWPQQSGVLSQIDVVRETFGSLGQRTNYRVQQGLEDVPEVALLLTGVPQAEIDQLRLQYDLRAPQRAGFSNVIVLGDSELTHHTNVSGIYMDSLSGTASLPYLLQNYVGTERCAGLPIQCPAAVGDNELPDGSLLSPPLEPSAVPELTGILDGDFERTASLQALIAAQDLSPIGQQFMDRILANLQDPLAALQFSWLLSGDVQVLTAGSDTSVRLQQAPGGNPFLRQFVVMPENAESLNLVVAPEQVGPNDLLEISFAGTVLLSAPLATLATGVENPLSVPLTGLDRRDGTLQVSLVGPLDMPASVLLDDLQITTIVNHAPQLAAAGLQFTAIPKNVSPDSNPGLSVAALVAGQSDADANARQGVAIVGVASSGALQFSLNGGRFWRQVSNLSDQRALLLPPDAQIRFVPAHGFNGAVEQAITYRAWDQTTGIRGLSGELVTIDSVAGDSPYSNSVDALAIEVIDVTSSWQNPRNRYDVNDRSGVNLLDVLEVLSDLAKQGPRIVYNSPVSPTPPPYIDVNGDNRASLLDALEVLLYQRQSGSGEGEPLGQELASEGLPLPGSSQLVTYVSVGSGAIAAPSDLSRELFRRNMRKVDNLPWSSAFPYFSPYPARFSQAWDLDDLF